MCSLAILLLLIDTLKKGAKQLYVWRYFGDLISAAVYQNNSARKSLAVLLKRSEL